MHARVEFRGVINVNISPDALFTVANVCDKADVSRMKKMSLELSPSHECAMDCKYAIVEFRGIINVSTGIHDQRR